MSQTASVIVERSGRVAVLKLNRPEVLNAFDAQMRCTCRDRLRELASDEQIRAVVIAGEGRLFSSGADLKAGVPSAAGTSSQLLDEYGPGLRAIVDMPKPVIAALEGPAVGIGLAYALTCDLRVMAESAYLQAPFNDIGLMPDGGLSWLLPTSMGYARAFELVADSRQLSAAECLALGLVNRVVADGTALEQACAWAAALAERPALALAATKKAMRQALSSAHERILRAEAELQAALVQSADCAEGIAAFRDKRKPTFTGR